MNLGYVLGEVFVFYSRILFVVMAYFFAKIVVAQNRRSDSPTLFERLWRYIACVGIVAIIATFAASNVHGNSDEGYVVEGEGDWNYNRGLIVFFTLLVACLIGVADGLCTPRRDIRPPNPE